MKASPNLFEALFDFHPRELHTPKENFLTESFAYLLRTDEEVCNLWISRLLGKNVKVATCEIKTHQTEIDEDAETSIYPDLLLDGSLSDGQPFAVYCEHKWDSPCDEQQLRKYRKVADKAGKHARLVFVGASQKQRREALRCFPEDKCGCFLWEDVYQILNAVSDKSNILMEFITFMKNQGLSPGQPLTVERMRAFLHGDDFVGSLQNLCHKLDADYPWEALIPKRFHYNRRVQNAYGRVGVRFATEDEKPVLSFGFLYDVSDHRVAFVNSEKGIDLLLRIETEPKNSNAIQSMLEVMKAKRKDLLQTAASVLLKDERGNGNKHSLIIIRDCLGDVIEGAVTEASQLEAIRKRLATWLEILFKDGKLEDSFKKSGLASGMKYP